MKSIQPLALTLAVLNVGHADVLVYESFGDTAGGASIEGYQTTTEGLSIGLSGTWSVLQGANQTLTQNLSPDWDVAQATNGHAIEQNGGSYHYWEATGGSWGIQRAATALSSGIDMSADGTWYLSFFYKGGNIDSVWQAGLTDGTDELMVGQGFGARAASPTQGVDAFYEAVGGGAQGSSGINPPWTAWKAQLFVAKFEKTDSGNSDTLTVSLINYDLNTTSLIDIADPASWLYTETITGVDNVFTNLQLKVAGPNGQYPAIDEIRVGETWQDATGTSSEPSAPQIGTQPPASVDGTVGGSVNITAGVIGSPAPDLQWEVSEDNGVTWADVPGATSATLTLSDLTLSMDATVYRLVATNTEGSATSDEAWLFVSYGAPEITAQPVSVTIDVGTAAAFTVAATGADETNFPLEYQWQRSSDLGETWSDVVGETADALSFASVSPADSDLYRVIVTDPAPTQDALPATETISNSVYLRATDPSQGFVYNENGAMVYDGLGADAAINPHQVFDSDIAIGIGMSNTGTLEVNGGTLTLNNIAPWAPKIGQSGGTATVTVNAGTLNIRDAGGDTEARLMIASGNNTTGTLILDGGDVNVSIGADDDGERGFYICKGTGTGTLDLLAGTLSYGSDAPVRVGATIAGADYTGTGAILVGNGHIIISGTSNVVFGLNDYIDFQTGGTGSVSIFLWDSLENVVNPSGYDSFKALIDAGNVRINGVVAAAGDYSPFLFSDDGDQGVMRIDPAYELAGYTQWAADNADGQGADEDFDGDGLPNGVEYFMNTTAGFTANPSVEEGSVTWPNGGNIPSTAYGTQFKVQTSVDLVAWDDMPDTDANLTNTASAVGYTLPTGAGKLFVRLVVTPD